MVDFVDFLEQLGQQARWREATRDELEQELEDADIPPAVRAAIFSGEQRQLETVVGAQATVCCMIAQPRFDDEDDDGKKGQGTDGGDGNVEETPLKRVAIAR